MKLTIHPTSKIVELVLTDLVGDGPRVETLTCPARLWEGVTEDGIRVNMFVTRVVPILERDDPRQAAFQKTLEEVEPPSATADAWPTRLIL